MIRSTATVLLAMSLLAGCGDSGPAGPGPEEGPIGQVAKDRYIVTLAASARPEDVTRAHGLQPHVVYRHVLNGFAARIPPQAHAGLLRNPHVERIEADGAVVTSETVQEGATWGLDRIDQRGDTPDGRYAYDYTGSGVTVYIVDTGIRYSHQDFGGRAVPGFDVFGGDGSDCHGHGTHVAGIAGSRTYGVAKDVRLVSVRVLGCSGPGTVSDAIAGLDWVVGQSARPAIVNMSLTASANASLDEAVRRAVQSGLVVVAAAGNNYADACSYSPGRAPEVITTGAMDPNGGRSVFSNYGSCVDIFAPGRFITSTSSASDVGIVDMAGTSMAAPHVAGAAALVLEEMPGASPADVTATLLNRATRGAVAKSNTRNNDLLYTRASDDSGDDKGGGNESPSASFTFACTGLSCAFTDWSTDRDGQVVGWTWSFGDGSRSTQQNTSHAYAGAGQYSVTLTITDNAGATGSTTQVVTVQPPPSSTPPTASFTFECTDLVCTFSDRSAPADADLVHWEWNFGDGSSLSTAAASSNPSHVYASPGSYRVRLTVWDEIGGMGESIRDVTVEGIALTVQGTKSRGFNQFDLTWSGVRGDAARITLDGAELATVPNTGQYRYQSASRGKTTFIFRVCESDGTRCSAEVRVALVE